MENETTINGNKNAKKMAKKIVDWLYLINCNKYNLEKWRVSRRFRKQQDIFVQKIINTATQNNYDFNRINQIHRKNPIHLLVNDLTKNELREEYNKLEKTLNFFISHCTEDYKKKLIEEWNRKKKEDYEKWINLVFNHLNIKNKELQKMYRQVCPIGKPITRESIEKFEQRECDVGKIKYKVQYKYLQ